MDLTGVFAPLPTPFDESGALDRARFAAALPRWMRSPLTGFVVLGTNGEAGLLDDAEAASIIDTARSFVPRDRPLIAGTARESTGAAIIAARGAAAAGADAVLVRTPCFFKAQMTGAAFERHYTAIADASPVPVLLYNFTAATGVNLLPETVARLAQHPNIIGIKESGSDMVQIADLVAVSGPHFSVLAGSASTFHAALCAGVSGGILALGALLPDACVRLFELVREARYDDARELQRRLLPLARLISTGHGVPGLKAALRLSGVDVGWPRLPLSPAPDAVVSALRSALHTFEEAFA
ncbi:MAG TPA: dihydrodipicolinate synthase family protein [Vicinamibacterales bacterium]|nr:dihydrodipicolinate synthase family protein [Vicinamibacterales bacterium]